MFSKVKAWFTAEVTSIETILSGFYTTVAKLEQHAVEKFAEAKEHAESALRLSWMASAAEANEAVAKADAQTAAEVAEKIKGLVTADVADVSKQGAAL